MLERSREHRIPYSTYSAVEAVVPTEDPGLPTGVIPIMALTEPEAPSGTITAIPIGIKIYAEAQEKKEP